MTTPTCPNCGAKFSHDNAALDCKVCGIPDEVVTAGQGAINKWRKQVRKDSDMNKKLQKTEMRNRRSTANKSKRAHGRQ